MSAKGEADTSSPGRPVSHSEPGAVAQAEVVKNVLYILREEQVGFYMWLIFIKYRWRFISIPVKSMLINSYDIPMVTRSSQFRMLSSPSRALLLLTSSLSSFHCIGVSRSQAHIDILPFV